MKLGKAQNIFLLCKVDKKEEYLSSIAAYVFNQVPQFCFWLVKEKLGVKIDSSYEDYDVSVETESCLTGEDLGRVDIEITLRKKDGDPIWIAIENKIGADFTETQTSNSDDYVKQIDKYIKDYGKDNVFLFYKWIHDVEQANNAKSKISWNEVYHFVKEYLRNEKNKRKKEDQFILEQFCDYLVKERLAMQKIGWEIINGAKALTDLHNMIEGCLEKLKNAKQILKYRRKSVMPHLFWLTFDTTAAGTDEYALIYHFERGILYSACNKSKSKQGNKDMNEVLESTDWKFSYINEMKLDAPDNSFLCKDQSGQEEVIYKFILESIGK